MCVYVNSNVYQEALSILPGVLSLRGISLFLSHTHKHSNTQSLKHTQYKTHIHMMCIHIFTYMCVVRRAQVSENSNRSCR